MIIKTIYKASATKRHKWDEMYFYQIQANLIMSLSNKMIALQKWFILSYQMSPTFCFLLPKLFVRVFILKDNLKSCKW